MKINLIIIIAIVLPLFSFSQKHTVSGYIEDATNGEKLLGANVFNANTYQGTITNNYGFYSFTQEAGKVVLRYSFVGYQPIIIEFGFSSDTTINISLQPSVDLEEVVVESTKLESAVQSSQMSVTELSMQTIKSLPVFMGEIDIIKTIQLLPGVLSRRDAQRKISKKSSKACGGNWITRWDLMMSIIPRYWS